MASCSSGEIRQLIWHLSSQHILRDTSAKLPTLRHPEKICLPVPHSYSHVGLTQPNSSFSCVALCQKNVKQPTPGFICPRLYHLTLLPGPGTTSFHGRNDSSPHSLLQALSSINVTAKGARASRRPSFWTPSLFPLARPLQYGSELC